MAYTKFGEFMRVLRVKNHEVMGDIAKMLGVSVPFLSAQVSYTVPHWPVSAFWYNGPAQGSDSFWLLQCNIRRRGYTVSEDF